MNESFLTTINVPFTFSRRPQSIPPDLRPKWRVAMLLLVLYHSKSNQASLMKLHVLNWAIRTPESRRRFLSYIKGRGSPEDVIIRFEPGLNLAIDFARGEGLIKIEKADKIKLTDYGLNIALQIDIINDGFVDERNFLMEVKPFVNENNIKNLLSWEVSS